MWPDRDMARNHCLLLGWSTFPYSTWDVLNGKIPKDQLSILSCRLYEHFIWSGANRGSIESRYQLKKAAANWLILSFIFINRNSNSNFLFCGSDPKPISIRIHRNNLDESRNPSRRNDDVWINMVKHDSATLWTDHKQTVYSLCFHLVSGMR